MSNVIASERSFGSAAPQQRTESRPYFTPNTDYLDLSYDSNRHALWVYLSTRAPAFASLEVIQDILGVDHVFAQSRTASGDLDPPLAYKIMASKRPGVFSLGGDLARFRYLIDQADRGALSEYAHAALDAVWLNTQTSGRENLTTIALVQGEAQGGGFEAALSAHVLVAEKGAMFGFPEALFGMFPGMGGFALLAARAGADCAKRLIGSTNRYSAEMLYEMGVIDVLADERRGKNAVNDFIAKLSPTDASKYQNRFAELDRAQLEESVEQWVDQALSLDRRQLRTMGYILEAQKRSSQKPKKATVTRLRKPIGFADLHVEEIASDKWIDAPSPALVSLPSRRHYAEDEVYVFVRNSRPWLHGKLTQHGAVVLRGFSTLRPESVGRIAAAFRTSREFDASRAVPALTKSNESVHVEYGLLNGAGQTVHNVYSDCPIFPGIRILSTVDELPDKDPIEISIANTASVYTQLPPTLVAEFNERGIMYRRRYRDANRDSAAHAPLTSMTWQQVLKVSNKREAEKRCLENGLSFRWKRDSSIELWNCATATITHATTAMPLWFNQVHLYDAYRKTVPSYSALLTKIFGRTQPRACLDVNFSDGTEISESDLALIAQAHQNATMSFALQPGDVLIVDNAQSAIKCSGVGPNQRILNSMF